MKMLIITREDDSNIPPTVRDVIDAIINVHDEANLLVTLMNLMSTSFSDEPV